MKNDKKRTLILLLVLALVIAAVVIILVNRPASPEATEGNQATNEIADATNPPAADEVIPEAVVTPVVSIEEGAKAAWAATGRTDVPSSVSCVTYTDRASLGADFSEQTVLVPMEGLAYVFGPEIGQGDSLADGLMVVFVSNDGQVLSKLSYSELMDMATVPHSSAADYMDAASFVMSQFLNGSANGTSLTPEQIDEMVR